MTAIGGTRESTTIVSASLPKVAWGKGSYVTDTSGKRYIDGSGGPAVYCLGYGHPEVNEAIKAQLDKVMHGYRYTFTSDPLEELTALVAQGTGADLDAMVFGSGGSEAVESCLKLALQYHSALGNMTRRRFIARQRSWHGNTLGALAISGFLERRAPFEGALVEASLLSQVNPYRPPPGVAPEALATYCAHELEQEILRLGASTIAAFVFEPVVGAAGGAVPAPPGYARLVRDICDRHGVLMIADEVMCGTGRCGTFRALEHDGVVPDIMAIAKGLGGGYIPLGAAIYGHKVRDAIKAAHGGPLTGHTFTGHTTACAAGVAVQNVINRDGLIERVRTKGPEFQAMITQALTGLEQVGDIRGRGFFLGIELVADPKTKAPFPRGAQLYLRVRELAFENGLICYPSGGNVDGVAGDTIILAPPYNASDDELAEIAEKLGRSMRQALASVTTA
jgi:adenosylmethionine-8-amino-7-oxononanoate aminotransferase